LFKYKLYPKRIAPINFINIDVLIKLLRGDNINKIIMIIEINEHIHISLVDFVNLFEIGLLI
jgi:hypothetical protein